MSLLGFKLELDRCPHCGRASPTLNTHWGPNATKAHDMKNERVWRAYVCTSCGGIITAAAKTNNQPVTEMYPQAKVLSNDIPKKPSDFLAQAIESKHAPSGAVMLCASAVDAMLKEKGYKKGTLNERINKAVEEHLITEDMGKWAHEVRLDANEPRHADENADMPTEADAQKSIDFALALAEILFVLPARIERGYADATS